MHKIYKSIFILFSLLVFSKPKLAHSSSTPSFVLEFGKTEIVYDWSVEHCAEWDIPDFAARALIDSSGNLQLYTSNEQNRKAIGANLSEIKHSCDSILPSHHNSDPRSYDDYEFLTSPYTIDGQTIYGLTHTEYHAQDYNKCNSSNVYDCWWNSINFVTSTDQGATFTHSSPPTQNIANTSIDVNVNNTSGHMGFFQPSNILYKDGFYYAKMQVITPGFPLKNNNGTFGGVCVMRTKNIDDPNSWRLWDGQGFNVSPKGVPASGTCANTFRTDWDWHFNTYLNKIVAVGAIPQGMVQTASTFTDVDTPMYIFPNLDQISSKTMYYTFLQPGAETRNFEDIGRSPWLYYMGCGAEVDCSQGWSNNRDLKRVRVRFNKPEDVGRYEVLDLKFNEYKGIKTLDSSFYGNDGSLSGNATFKQEGVDKFIHFNNDPGNVTIKDNVNLRLTGSMTFSARIRTKQKPSPSTYPSILLKQGSRRNYGIFLTPDGRMHLSISSTTGVASSTSNHAINDGTWHNILITFSDVDGIARFYIDGKFDSQSLQEGKLSYGIDNGDIIIGGNSFIGDIDHATLYNYLLPTPNAGIIPGDLNDDGKVNLYDYTELIRGYATLYTDTDFINIITNYGR